MCNNNASILFSPWAGQIFGLNLGSKLFWCSTIRIGKSVALYENYFLGLFFFGYKGLTVQQGINTFVMVQINILCSISLDISMLYIYHNWLPRKSYLVQVLCLMQCCLRSTCFYVCSFFIRSTVAQYDMEKQMHEFYTCSIANNWNTY